MADWDVTLNGVDYMLVPRSYRSYPNGNLLVDSRLGRQRIDNLALGLAFVRPTGVAGGGALGRAGVLEASGALPAPWPSGVALGPAPAAQSVTTGLNSSEPKLAVSDTAFCYLAAGTTLYRWNQSVGSAPVDRKTLAAAARGICRYQGLIYIAYGASADVGKYDDTSNMLTAAALGAGVKALSIISWAGALAIVPNGALNQVAVYWGATLQKATTFLLDGKVLNWVVYGDALVIATDAGLYRLTGSWEDDGVTPAQTFKLASWGTLSGYLQDADDFAWLVVYAGRLLAWVGGKALLYDAARDWWRHAGLEGAATYGAAVVNGYLCVSAQHPYDTSRTQLWAYNGSGWWSIDQATSPNTLVYPVADGAGKLVTFRSANAAMFAYDLSDVTTAATLASPWSVTTPLLDANEPDRQKAWRRVGVELSRLDGKDVGSWVVQLAYSTDGGTTYTIAGAQTVTSELASVSFALSSTSAGLIVKATLTRTSGLPPFVTSIWVEHETLNDSLRRRRWQFVVRAGDGVVNRLGVRDARDGQTIRTALWSLYAAATTFAFRDVDYGATSVTKNVRMLGLREEWPAPSDQSTLGAETTLEVTLVEV